MSAAITPTPYQHTVLSVPEEWNLMLAGGRGGGKSTGMQLITLRHIEKYRADARPLLIRETHKAVSELEEQLDSLLVDAYGKKIKHNRAEHTIRVPGGAILELGQLEGPGDYKKYQGRSFTLLGVDEYGLVKDPRWVHMLKSNLRAAPGIPLRTVLSANPGGANHANIHQNYIARNLAWQPFETVDGETFVVCPSVLTDNPHIDQESYTRMLRSSCSGDEDLLRAWLSGDWNISRGAYFAGSVDEKVHMLPATFSAHLPSFKKYVSLDWGSSAPAVCYVVLRSTGERDCGPYPAGSVLLVDELALHVPNDLNTGLQWPPGKLAEAMRELAAKWGMKSVSGVGDDARGLEDTLLSVLRQHRVYLNRPRKERVAGWAKMRELLHNARERNGRPGLWVSARCKYWWRTVPFLQRDEHRPEDVDTNGADHGADACRYAVMHSHAYVRSGRTHGF